MREIDLHAICSDDFLASKTKDERDAFFEAVSYDDFLSIVDPVKFSALITKQDYLIPVTGLQDIDEELSAIDQLYDIYSPDYSEHGPSVGDDVIVLKKPLNLFGAKDAKPILESGALDRASANTKNKPANTYNEGREDILEEIAEDGGGNCYCISHIHNHTGKVFFLCHDTPNPMWHANYVPRDLNPDYWMSAIHVADSFADFLACLRIAEFLAE